MAFAVLRAVVCIFPGGRISAFGAHEDQIGSIVVINLDRQPRRWSYILRELNRFRTSDGTPLRSLVRRFSAVDARDGLAVAATADVDSTYRMGDQLYVQPEPKLEECFSADVLVTMTRQEIAIARSHVEVWKAVVAGPDDHVLVLEDDVWFPPGAAAAIDRGWRAALRRCRTMGGPHLLYLSYADAGGTAGRSDPCDALFHPERGLWFLSGYVLSRKGAASLLSAMPVVGPVDLWINYRFEELGVLALATPAILQRPDVRSDNAYSILPYLARAGIVDAVRLSMAPGQSCANPVLAWTAGDERESLAMALSMLGLRVRAFDGDEATIQAQDVRKLFETFDALVNAPLSSEAVSAAIATMETKFVFESNTKFGRSKEWESLPRSRLVVLSSDTRLDGAWAPLCSLLGLAEPAQFYPKGAPRSMRIFRDDRFCASSPSIALSQQRSFTHDESPWILPRQSNWKPSAGSGEHSSFVGAPLFHERMTKPSPVFTELVETFPGNLASFTREGLLHEQSGVNLVVRKDATTSRPYRSGAFSSVRLFEHGRFEAEIKAASGSGLVTSLFLYRDGPRQEIDVELAGNDPRRMLVNVYFNPGDDGAEMSFGYRGSPCRVDLGFDATIEFHLYAIDWRPGHIAWSVDGRVVHERVGWDPTPIPHLPMRLFGNLWVPRSDEIAGRIDDFSLPATAIFRNVSVWS